MGRRWKTALVTLALTVAGVAGAAPAQAAGCTITGFSPRSVVVGLTPITRTFTVSATGCRLEDWMLNDADYSFFTYKDSPQDTFNPSLFGNSDAGAKDVIVEAFDSSFASRERTFARGFSLLRRTSWQSGTFNASPEPVRKGGTISIAGRLLLADWDQDRYIGYSSRAVAVQFRTPTGTYTTVKTVTTDRNGWVRTTVPARTTGVWRLTYGGNSVSGPATAVGDSVQVTR